jgi:hypothetical protein
MPASVGAEDYLRMSFSDHAMAKSCFSANRKVASELARESIATRDITLLLPNGNHNFSLFTISHSAPNFNMFSPKFTCLPLYRNANFSDWASLICPDGLSGVTPVA